MLFSYKPINHDIEALHNFLQHTVLEVWCKAKGNFSKNKLHPGFKDIVKSFPENLYNPIKEIYGLCKNLSPRQRRLIEDVFKTNNSIKELCEGSVSPILYSAIENDHPQLAKKIKKFCRNLYSEILCKDNTITKNYKTLKEFYKDFILLNTKKCPFCGLIDFEDEFSDYREEIDHYFPKSRFPFNSVNILNFAPACHKCNVLRKFEKNPIVDESGKKRKAFYPYAANNPVVEISIKINNLEYPNLIASDIDINITSATQQEEVDTWRDIYEIDQVYLQKCRSEDAKDWIDRILSISERNNDSDPIKYTNPDDYINDQIKFGKINPLSNCNFLKVPFLKAYKEYKL